MIPREEIQLRQDVPCAGIYHEKTCQEEKEIRRNKADSGRNYCELTVVSRRGGADLDD